MSSFSGGGGKVLQVVFKEVTAASFSSASASFVDVTDLSLDITISDAANKVLVICESHWGTNRAGHSHMFKMLRGAVEILCGVGVSNRLGASRHWTVDTTTNTHAVNISGLDAPGATGVHTYKLQTFAEAGSINYLNRGAADNDYTYMPRLASRITLIEIEGA